MVKYLSLPLLLALPNGVMATPAYPSGWTASQPDGLSTGGMQFLVGTPSYHYSIVESIESYYVTIMDESDGFIKYATIDETTGRFVPTEYVVGIDAPEDHDAIKSGLAESADVIAEKCSENAYCVWHSENNGMQHSRAPGGDLSNLIVPFHFADHDDRTLKVHGMEANLFNDHSSSVKDYFQKQSYGKITLTSDLLAEVTISKTEAECAGGVSGLTTTLHDCLDEAVQLAGVDPEGYASITFVHSGYGAEFGNRDIDGAYYDDRIWSHSWEMEIGGADRRYAIVSAFYGTAGGHQNTVGVIVHEIAQTLGAPTLYGDGFGGFGLGYYDVMANPWGFDGNGRKCGSMSAYTKSLFGWSDIEEITESGSVEISSTTSSDLVYKVGHGFPNPDVEYLLIENRDGRDYDSGMNGIGLAIYHVDLTANDKAGFPGDGSWPANHYRVALIQSDARFDLEVGEDPGDVGDLFNAEGVDSVTDYGPVNSDELNPLYEGYPNTKAYMGGTLIDTAISISEISNGGELMTFTIEFSDIDDEEQEET